MTSFIARIPCKKFVCDEAGSTVIEYAAIASMISIVILVAVFEIGGTVQQQFVSIVGGFGN